jgi:hypothetical protein
MKRHFVIILIVVLLGGGIWAWVLVSKVQRAQNNLESAFNNVTSFYVAEGKDHVAVLATLSGSTITQNNSDALADIAFQLARLGTTTDTATRIDVLIAAQRRMYSFFSQTGLSDELTSNPHYKHWSKEVSSNGEASALIHDYNQALAVYNTSLKNPVAHTLKPWPNTEFLSVNGVTQKDTLITF